MNPSQVTPELIANAQGGDSDAMWTIVSAFEGLLLSAVRSMAPKATDDDRDDLLQEARAALIQYVRAYKTGSSSAALHTFAHHGVRRAVAEEWARMSTGLTMDPTTVIRVKRALWQADGDVDRAWALLSAATDPRDRMSRERFVAAVEALGDVMSLEAPAAGGDQDTNLADTIPDPTADFTDSTVRRDLARFLLREIPKRQSLALRAFHGIGMTRMTDADTALDMQVTPVSVRTFRTKGIASCRSVAAAHGIAA
ncbi:hypothetical protein ACFUGD_01165 [Streptomyces sp. NPDC057217]|uniref:hypothetical protein n=1 Tax=Streptomyces sp. NPDC057217 TaxID=3346054 RepID=UPI00362B7F1C